MPWIPRPPADLTTESMELFRGWLQNEFRRLKQHLQQPDGNFFKFDVLSTEPPKPVEGQVAYADGTNWNPGSGKGLYLYGGSPLTWTKL